MLLATLSSPPSLCHEILMRTGAVQWKKPPHHPWTQVRKMPFNKCSVQHVDPNRNFLTAQIKIKTARHHVNSKKWTTYLPSRSSSTTRPFFQGTSQRRGRGPGSWSADDKDLVLRSSDHGMGSQCTIVRMSTSIFDFDFDSRTRGSASVLPRPLSSGSKLERGCFFRGSAQSTKVDLRPQGEVLFSFQEVGTVARGKCY